MKKERKRLEVWPTSASNIAIEEEFCHSAYSLEVASEAEATESGLLRLFSLIPRHPAMPTFHGRWDARDGMSPRADASAIDIDVEGVSEQEKRDFKSGRKGFSGHHSVKLDEGKHKIFIATPQLGRIFSGVLEMSATATAFLHDTVEVIRGESIRIFNAATGETLFEYDSAGMDEK